MDEVYVLEFKEKPLYYLRRVSDSHVAAKPVPRDLWYRWVDLKSEYYSLMSEIRWAYLKKPKDKPLNVLKYRVEEGETHRFNDDGTISVGTAGKV